MDQDYVEDGSSYSLDPSAFLHDDLFGAFEVKPEPIASTSYAPSTNYKRPADFDFGADLKRPKIEPSYAHNAYALAAPQQYAPQPQLQYQIPAPQPRPVYAPTPASVPSDRATKLKHWLSHFHNYFKPLLPSRNYFTSAHLPAVAQIIGYEAIPQPQAIQGTMKDYQLTGLSFMVWLYRNGANGILGDEMGLGKTLQTLAVLAWTREQLGVKGPHLIVCPLSVLGSWMTEAQRWLPAFRTKRMHGSANERNRLKAELRTDPVDIVITTYDCYLLEADAMKAMCKWHYVVLDEGHKIKNSRSNISQALYSVPSVSRLLLTGTPLQNNLTELWSLAHWLYPAIFDSESESKFTKAFDLGQGVVDSTFMAASQMLLRLIMMRRTKEGVAGELSVPPRHEHTLYVPLSPLQRFWYERLLTKTDKAVFSTLFDRDQSASAESSRGPATPVGAFPMPGMDNSRALTKKALAQVKAKAQAEASEKGKNTAWQKLQNLLMQLRKVCIHPYLISEAEPEPYEISEHIVVASAKFVLLDKLLKRLVGEQKRKILIFSGFTRTLDTLENHMRLRDYSYARLDGSTSRPRRALDMRLFQAGKFDVYLISTRAGGLGINLTAASAVVMLDLDFNPQVTAQAIARAHRIGQDKEIDVFYVVAQDSVEDQMMTRINKKRYLATKIMGTGAGNHAHGVAELQVKPETNSSNYRKGRQPDAEQEVLALNANELRDILRGGSAALAMRWQGAENEGKSAFDAFSDSTIDQLLERSKSVEQRRNVKLERELGVMPTAAQQAVLLQQAAEEEQELLQGIEKVETRLWEGKMVHLKPRSNADIASEWTEMTKGAREKKARTVKIDGYDVTVESIGCSQWEAVKTIVDPKNVQKPPGRRRAVFEHQDYCITCYDGGEVYMCATCPRVMHASSNCTGIPDDVMAVRIGPFSCSQHSCFECGRTTADSGGLLFRCQCCWRAYCEDCLPTSGWDAVGDTLPEFRLLGFGQVAQAYFIRCPHCLEVWSLEPEAHESFLTEQKRVAAELEKKGLA